MSPQDRPGHLLEVPGAAELAKFPDANPNVVLRLNVAGKITYYNSAASQLLQQIGFDENDLERLLPPDMEKRIVYLLLHHTNNCQVEHKLGDRTILYTMRAFRGEDSICLCGTDITELKKKSQALQEDEQRYRALVEGSIQGIYINQDFIIQFTNPATAKIFGYDSADELIGQDFRTLVAPHEHTRLECYQAARLKGKPAPSRYEYQGLRKDGQAIWIECLVSLVPWNGKPAVMVAFLDTTERRLAEEEIKARARQQTVVAELGQCALVDIDLPALMDETVFRVSQTLNVEYCKILELLPGGNELLLSAGTGWTEGLVGHARVTAGSDSEAGDTLLAGEPVIIEDLRKETRFRNLEMLREHGVISGVSVVIPGHEQPFGVLGVYSTELRSFTEDDVLFLQAVASILATTIERQRTQKEFIESEGKYRKLIETASDAIFVADAETGIILDVNLKAEELLGMSAGEIVGMHQSQLHPQEETERYKNLFRDHVRQGKTFSKDVLICRRDGRTIPVEITASTLELGGKKIIQGIFRDVTERKRAEEALRYRIEFEKLITTISTNFINLATDEIDAGVNRALQEIGTFTGVDRSYIFLYSEDGTKMDNTYEWCAEGTEPQINRLQGLLVDAFPWFNEKIKQNEVVHIPRVADLPPEVSAEKKEFETESIRSLICVALVYGNRVKGFVGFDSVHEEKTWPEDVIALLKIAGEIFVNGLERKRAEASLKEALSRFEAVIENTPFVAVQGYDQNGVVRHWNTASQHLYGFSATEAAGQRIQDLLLSQEAVQEFEHTLSEVWDTGTATRPQEWPVHTRDGEKRWVYSTMFPIFEHGSVVEVFCMDVDITERKQTEEVLRYRIEFENIITNLSTDFINLSTNEVDQSISRALQKVGQFVDADRSYVVLISKDSSMLDTTHEWCAEGIEHQIDLFRNIPIEKLAWARQEIDELKILHIPRVADLPPEAAAEKEEFQRQDVQSMVCLPMYSGNTPIGLVGFDAVRTEKVWTDEIIALLRVLAEIFVNALERKQAEEALRESEERFRTLVENIPIGVYRTTPDGRILNANPALVSMLGYDSFEELTSRNLEEEGYAVGYSRHEFCKLIERDGEVRGLESAWKKRDGPTLFISEYAKAIRDADGKVLYYEGTVEDITERKRAEEALEQLRRHNEMILNSAGEGIYGLDLEGRTTFVNPAAARMIGYEPQELIGKHQHTVLHHSQQDGTPYPQERCPIYAAFKDGKVHHVEHEVFWRKDGSCFPVEYTSTPIRVNGKIIGAVVTFRDITERKQAEEDLRESRHMLQLVMDNIPQFIFWKDTRSVYLGCNQNFARVAGVGSPQQIIGKTDYDLAWRKEEADFFRECDRRVMETNQPEYHILEPQLQADGKQAWLDTNKVPLHDAEGRVVGILGTYEDITERKQAEEALRESEIRYRTLFEGAFDAIFLYDEEGIILDVNEKACQMYAYSREELLHLSVGDPLSAKGYASGERVTSLLKRAHSGETLFFEWMGRRKDGSTFPEEVSLKPIMISGQRYLLGIIREVTERKKAEEEKERLQAQLYQSQKMESIGLLAGGIAHDFNNLLGGILGFASLASQQVGLAHPAAASLDLIVQSVEKATKLTRELLAYARGGPHIREVFDLNRLVEDMLNLLRANTPRNVEIERQLSEDQLVVHADPSQLQQVIMNLCINAGEAIGNEPGKITIITGKRVIREGEKILTEQASMDPGEYIYLEVSDTGCGLTDAEREKIFEPFYSTKRFGRGMGLAAVQGIVANHQGCVEIESTPGVGTCFRVLIPATQKKLPEQTFMKGIACGGSETILVADDDEVIRNLAEACLTKLGYTVIMAINGEEAVEIYKQRSGEIKLVILDLMMPGMNGEQVFSALQKISPDVKILLSSGYSESMAQEQVSSSAVCGFLQKPYTVQTLGEFVRKTLDKN